LETFPSVLTCWSDQPKKVSVVDSFAFPVKKEKQKTRKSSVFFMGVDLGKEKT